MIDLLWYVSVFVIGYFIGSYLSASKYERLDWHTMKWNPDCLGFRKVPDGTKILKGEKAVLCVTLETSMLEPGQALLVHHGEEDNSD
jgi:hypothetical protein